MAPTKPNLILDPDQASVFKRLAVGLGLIASLRKHDFFASVSFMNRDQLSTTHLGRFLKFMGWVMHQMFSEIPNALTTVFFSTTVSRTSVWLAAKNPLSYHPWATHPNAQLPSEVEVAVIGAGFTGAACAYHWSKQKGGLMVVLEMNEASSGASGRNEGLVVMGRFFAYVKHTVLENLTHTKSNLTSQQLDILATKFASAYVKAAYKNGDLVEKTIRDEGFECDYVREGWVQGDVFQNEHDLDKSISISKMAGFEDWTKLDPDEVFSKSGMNITKPAGFSKRTASWHPAKWVWSLLSTAIKTDHVKLFTHTKVIRVEDKGKYYSLCTDRGRIRARFVINATESYTATLYPQFRKKLHAIQTQAAWAEGGPQTMKPHVGIQSKLGFFSIVENGVLFGSDGTRIPYRNAGINNPSRFITKALIAEMLLLFGRNRATVKREWSCTAGFTDDEFPIVGIFDNKRQYIIGGMCGSGSSVHFNGARHVVHQILGLDGPDDYPSEYFSPTRVIDPDNHRWPSIDDGKSIIGKPTSIKNSRDTQSFQST